MRTAKQIMADRLLLLFAISHGNEHGSMDVFKLMKIPFMAELKSTGSGVNTFNYRFYRHTYGPMTTAIYEDGDALHCLDLATDKSKGPIKLTEKGERLLGKAGELYEHNAAVCAYVAEAAAKFAPLSFPALKKKVYAQVVTVGGEKTTIKGAPAYSTVLKKLENPKLEFDLADDWIDTLWGAFHYTEEEQAMAERIRPVEAVMA